MSLPSPPRESQPPLSAIAYHVTFGYSIFDTPEAFWQDYGRAWSAGEDRWIGPGPAVKAAVAKLTSPSDTPEQKLRKLYQAVLELDNLSDDRNQGANQFDWPQIKSIDELLTVRRGSNDQINDLFVAMARAAGITVYVMRVADYRQHVFNAADLTSVQLDDNLTVAVLDGKELFLDPGTRFCPFGHLSSKHSGVPGIRQSSAGPAIGTTPIEPIRNNQLQRTALLNLDEQGVTSGTVKLTYVSTAGISLRQLDSARGDTAVRDSVKNSLVKHLPAGATIDIVSVDKAKEYEEPLVITASVKGNIAITDGTKVMLKSGFFEQQDEQQFKSETRKQSVCLDVTNLVADAVQINLPASMALASGAVKTSENINKDAAYAFSVETAANSLTIQRSLVIGRLIYPLADYPELRSFYQKIYAGDQTPIVVSKSPTTSN